MPGSNGRELNTYNVIINLDVHCTSLYDVPRLPICDLASIMIAVGEILTRVTRRGLDQFIQVQQITDIVGAGEEDNFIQLSTILF